MPSREEMENAEIRKRAKFLRKLLSEFGASLSGFDPGVTANLIEGPACKGDGYFGEHLCFDAMSWRWLEPILVELRNRRMGREIPIKKHGTIPLLAHFKDMPMSYGMVRKTTNCKQCGQFILEGSKAYRPMLGGQIGGIIRCDRICVGCMMKYGADFITGL